MGRTLVDIFEALRPFVWPKYREEGPPEFVQNYLLGHDLTGGRTKLEPPARSILEMMTIGYRPVSSLAILDILSDSPNLAMHGMQLARELERRFKVQEGWFTRTRYYTDRVGKLLPRLTKMQMIEELVRKDSRTGRTSAAYRINPTLSQPVKSRLQALSRGEHVSLLSNSPATTLEVDQSREWRKECLNCGIITSSAIARYCEVCGRPLKMKCNNCRSSLEAIYKYCLNCGAKVA
jgi:hypothetical protein